MSRPALAMLLGACLTSAACAGASREEPTAVDLVVAATTDVHGRLIGWDYHAERPDSVRGLARAATIVDSVRRANPGRVILLDAGDLLQGNPLTYVAARVQRFPVHPVIAAMNAMHYDAAAIGNHEFNYGLDVLERSLDGATFPFLAANAWLASGARAYPAFHLVERAGVRIGVVGATTPGAMVWDRDNLQGRLVLRDIVPDVQRAAREAREAGAQLVVVTVHSGLDGPSSYDTVSSGVPSENVAARIAREVPGLALIVVGHSHREIADTVINGTLLVQPRNWAGSVAIAHLGLERRGDAWTVTAHRGTLVRTVGHPEDPSVVAAARPAHEATVAYVGRAIGTTPVAWRADSARVRDTPLIDFLLEVQRRAANADLASTAAFSLDASLDAGPITIAEVARLYPYENTLRGVRISGRQLREYLEFSARYFLGAEGAGAVPGQVDPDVPGFNYDIVAGAEYTVDVSRPVGSRVTRLVVKGRPVAETDTFTLALNNYRQTGGGGYAMLHDAPVVYTGETEIRQLLIDAVKATGELRPADWFRPNWTMVPESAVGVAYRSMHGGRNP